MEMLIFQIKKTLYFTKKTYGAKESDTETNLHNFLNTHKDIFVKLDIEGSEFSWINSLSDLQLQNIKQLVIEMHHPFNNWHVLSRLAQSHWLVHLHGNNCVNTTLVNNVVVPNVFECTYIRKSDLDKTPELNVLRIPTKIDQKNNPDKPDIELKDYPYQNIMCDIRKFEKKIQSQFGEAGIILEILKRINKKGPVVEIGPDFSLETVTNLPPKVGLLCLLMRQVHV